MASIQRSTAVGSSIPPAPTIAAYCVRMAPTSLRSRISFSHGCASMEATVRGFVAGSLFRRQRCNIAFGGGRFTDTRAAKHHDRVRDPALLEQQFGFLIVKREPDAARVSALKKVDVVIGLTVARTIENRLNCRGRLCVFGGRLRLLRRQRLSPQHGMRRRRNFAAASRPSLGSVGHDDRIGLSDESTGGSTLGRTRRMPQEQQISPSWRKIECRCTTCISSTSDQQDQNRDKGPLPNRHVTRSQGLNAFRGSNVQDGDFRKRNHRRALVARGSRS